MTAYEHAQRYVGMVLERSGPLAHPLIQWWLSLCGMGFDASDEIPWCSAFMNGIAWDLQLPRSKSAAARSWLTVGRPIPTGEASVGSDVVVLSRGANPAQGHVGWFAGLHDGQVYLCGGNQSNGITVAGFDTPRIVGIRRLA